MSEQRISKEPTFGERLMRARVERGATLDEVAQATRIPRRHLEALERADLDALPAGPFAKGYIEACAKALGIDPEPILGSYRQWEARRSQSTPERDRQMLDALSQLVRPQGGGESAARRQARRLQILLGAAALALLAVLGGSLARVRAREPAAVASDPRSESPAPVAATGPEPVRPPSSGAAGESPSTTGNPPATPDLAPGSRAAFPIEERPAIAADVPTAALEVADHGIGTDVRGRQLVGRAERFPAGTTVAFWTLVVGGRPGNAIRHVWFEGARPVMKARLPVGSAHFRTHSRLRLPPDCAEPWTVEARTSDGRLLVRSQFACEPAATRP